MSTQGTPDKKALQLSYFTLAYGIVECVLSIIFGVFSGSIALLGFGLDSLVESLSAGIMVWRFGKHSNMSEEDEEIIEERAEKFVGYTFLILGAYILYESLTKLVKNEIPGHSLVGICIAIASIITMPFLYYVKNKIGKEIKSKSLIADSKETLTCALLSIALFIGLGANYLFGFWQADPIVGFIIVFFLAKEGIELIKGKEENP